MNGLQPLFSIANVVVIMKKLSENGHDPFVNIKHIIPMKWGNQQSINVPLTTARVRTTFISFFRCRTASVTSLFVLFTFIHSRARDKGPRGLVLFGEETSSSPSLLEITWSPNSGIVPVWDLRFSSGSSGNTSAPKLDGSGFNWEDRCTVNCSSTGNNCPSRLESKFA